MSKATNGTSPSTPLQTDKNKDWQLELLMEKIRSKASQYKSFQETSKTVRMTMLDKRFSLDSVEKTQHQKCLDTLQQCIKVTLLQSMVERLESLSRQLGLKFMAGPSGVEFFISSDMFYLEVILDQTGAIRDVKVHHEGKTEQQSCAELVSCLSRQDFADFTAQLEGFASIYQLNAEKKIKCKAFTALQSLESDLNALAQKPLSKEPFNVVHKSSVGLLEKRRGGHAMRLTYFVSPYDLINEEKGELEPINLDSVISKSLGHSVTVCLEGSAAHKLQITPLLTLNRNVNGKSSPVFSQLTSQNSAVIPACFMLRLNKPMPMCVSLVKKIQQLTDLECGEASSTHPLLSLIATHASDDKLQTSCNKGLFVTLPDQSHCYFMTENKNMDGMMISGISFTHPSHVTDILEILRQQALFNALLSSCVRPNSKQDFENMIMFEISALSWTHISISLEHPIEETMATAEIDLSDIAKLQCHIQSPGTPLSSNNSDSIFEHATKVLNRSFSVPITMRAIIQMWDKQAVRKNHYNGHENFNLPLGSGDPGGHKGPPGNGLSDFGGLDGKIKQEPMNGSGLPHGMNLSLMSHSHQGVFLNESMMSSASFNTFPATDSPMLTNMELANILSGTASEKSSKRSKRKSGDDWKSTKRKGEDSELLLESSSCDSTSRSTPLSHETPSEISMMTPNSVVGFQSDLELSALDAAELIGNSDKVEFDNIDELGDVEEMLVTSSKEHKNRKSRDVQKSPSVDLENKSLVPPSVSITPISSSQGFNSVGMGAERRPGIEIIPLATTPPTSLPSSITITPISSSQAKNLEERSREKKSKSRSDEKSRIEKKRKRKRDESPMGPPDKIPSKQDPLNKPVSVSIKPAESPPLPPITPTSPSSMMRKFSASPTQNKSLSGKLSPSLMKSKSGSSHISPKHSPAHVPSSPKHTVPGMSSPKNHSASPKHPSTGSSGKPSMSTLKSAANSPSSKSSLDSLKNKSKDGSREKEKKFSVSNNKIKSSSVKLKQLDLSSSDPQVSQNDNLPSPTASVDVIKTGNSGQVRNRKGSLSAIVDKLKSAQHCDNVTDLSTKSSSNRERSGQTSSKVMEGNKSASKTTGTENKNSEYMVKPSSDGIKITINKTRTKDSSKLIKPQSGTGSPKTHTGLKPGVNSGPASKKPQQLAQKSSSPNMTNSTSNYGFKTGSSSSSKSLVNSKTSSGGLSSKLCKLSGSPKMSSATDLSRIKERPRINKSGSDKSIFSKERKSSPTQRDEDFKVALSKMDPYSTAPLVAEGLIKQLDKSFQIPKLSARNADDKNKKEINNINRIDAKMYDMMKNDSMSKYPLVSTKMFDDNMEKMRNSMNVGLINNVNLPLQTSSPKANSHHKEEFECENSKEPQNLTTTKDDYKHFANKFSQNSIASDLSSKGVDLNKFLDKKKDPSDVLLDFSNSSKGDSKSGAAALGNVPYTSSSSVSVHIVKSPAPSPRSAASPCISDDDLMDEALVGLGK